MWRRAAIARDCRYGVSAGAKRAKGALASLPKRDLALGDRGKLLYGGQSGGLLVTPGLTAWAAQGALQLSAPLTDTMQHMPGVSNRLLHQG